MMHQGVYNVYTVFTNYSLYLIKKYIGNNYYEYETGSGCHIKKV